MVTYGPVWFNLDMYGPLWLLRALIVKLQDKSLRLGVDFVLPLSQKEEEEPS